MCARGAEYRQCCQLCLSLGAETVPFCEGHCLTAGMASGAGPLVQSRITGTFEIIRAALPSLPVECFVRMDARGIRETSRKMVSAFLGRHARSRRILIATANDSSALGALDAVRQARRTRTVAIVGQGAIPEVLDELAEPRSALLGTVSHEAPMYGPEVMRLALSLLHGATVPPYNYVQHRLITRGSSIAK